MVKYIWERLKNGALLNNRATPARKQKITDGWINKKLNKKGVAFNWCIPKNVRKEDINVLKNMKLQITIIYSLGLRINCINWYLVIRRIRCLCFILVPPDPKIQQNTGTYIRTECKYGNIQKEQGTGLTGIDHPKHTFHICRKFYNIIGNKNQYKE